MYIYIKRSNWAREKFSATSFNWWEGWIFGCLVGPIWHVDLFLSFWLFYVMPVGNSCRVIENGKMGWGVFTTSLPELTLGRWRRQDSGDNKRRQWWQRTASREWDGDKWTALGAGWCRGRDDSNGRQQRTTAATHQDDDGGERGDETAMGDSGDVEDGGDDTWG